MKAKDFDFEKFGDWLAEKEEKTSEFLNGKSETNVLLAENVESDIVESNFLTCRTSEESLECQLDILTNQMKCKNCSAPFLEPWFGVGVFANAFGSEYIWTENESPQTHYIAHSIDDIEKYNIPDIDTAPIMNLVMETIDYFLNETHGKIPISCTDTQSPVDNATLICETSVFFMAMYENPEATHRFLDKITKTMVAFSKKQIELIGEIWARPGHIMTSSRGAKGISVSDDNIVMLSPDHYSEFAVPYNEILSREFGGIAIHSCGDFSKQLPSLMKTEGLLQVDGAFMKENIDPCPNTNYQLFKETFSKSNVILHARMNENWPEVFPKLYHPDMRLVLQIPPPAPNEPADKNEKMLEKLMVNV